MTERILVPFEGDGAGEEELTWGQIGFWQAMVGNGRSRTAGGVVALAPGTTVATLVEMLRFMMGRHEALRTRLVFDADGRARQSCAAAGEVPLEIVDADDRDPVEVAAEIQERYQGTNFDYEHEWPVRLAAVRRNGVLTHVVTYYLHLVIDADGLTALVTDVADRDPVTGAAKGPVTGTTPREQARQQRTPAALKQGAASLRHLEHVFRTMSPERFGQPRYDTTGYRELRYHSPATRLAIAATAARLGANTSAILLATFAVGLARFTGNSPVMAWLMVNNRFRPGFATSVSALVQISPFMIDVADTSLGEAITRAQSGAMRAYKYAYYDPYQQDELIDRINAERGVKIDYSCFYNDRRQGERDRTNEPTPTDEQITEAVRLGTYEWQNDPTLPRQKLYFHVDDPPDAIDFTMSVDTRYFDEDDMITILREMETVAVQTALSPTTPTNVTARSEERTTESLQRKEELATKT